MNSFTLYQLKEPLYKVTFPKVILKILESRGSLILLCKDKVEMECLDNLMWTFSQLSFVPHATEDDEYNESLQQILLSVDPNKFQINNKVIVLSSIDILTRFNSDLVSEVFCVTKDNPSNILREITRSSKVKHFIQNINNTWHVASGNSVK